MNKRYVVALFDLDGTVANTGDGVTNSVSYALSRLGEKEPENLYSFIGPPLAVSFGDFCGFDKEKTELAIKLYREYYTEKGILECELYEGIKELLSDLSIAGVKICLATSKPDIFAHRVVKNLGVEKYFDHLCCASTDEKVRATKKEVIEHALELCGIEDKSKIVMIGDRHFDICGANDVGIDSVGVTFGFGTEKELKEAGATYVAHNTKQIRDIILGMKH